MNTSVIRPIKNLGQNFLIDPNISRKIVDGMHIKTHDHILEIGPGEGALTALLIDASPRSVNAVEIDGRLVPGLQKRFGKNPRFHLIHGDFLKTQPDALIPPDRKIRIAGNLPYNVTSPILFHILDFKDRVTDLTIMVQKEVGERLAAKPGSKEYGIPSVLFQAAGHVECLFHVSRNAFRPVPAVESVIVSIQFHHPPLYQAAEVPLFKTVVKTAFNQRRKMLRNTLKAWFKDSSSTSVDLTRRPEQLHVHEWVALTEELLDTPSKA